jgi:hypothetical protein
MPRRQEVNATLSSCVIHREKNRQRPRRANSGLLNIETKKKNPSQQAFFYVSGNFNFLLILSFLRNFIENQNTSVHKNHGFFILEMSTSIFASVHIHKLYTFNLLKHPFANINLFFKLLHRHINSKNF